ncbi:MAG: cyclic peptide export ABC transporter [Cyanobacteria bacterium J06623_7]
MRIIRLLLQNSGVTFILAAIASLISGMGSAGMIAVINYAISNLPNPPEWLLWAFIGLGLLLWLFRFISWVMITRLSQEIVYSLRLDITQKILNCPLQHLETVGTPKLLAALTGDINAIAGASIQLAILLVNFAVLLGVFAYLCWLSPLLFVMVLGSILAGYGIYVSIQQQGIKFFNRSRQTQDVLFQHFRALTGGTKELKLHRPRRHDFIQSELKPTAQEAKYYWIKAITAFALAGSTGILLFFVPVGLIIFVFPQLESATPATISSYALAVLYAINPISEIVYSLPQLTQANISLKKVESLGLSLAEPVTEPDLPQGELPRHWSSLELVSVNHAYRGENTADRFALENIDLKFQPGEIVFIVGGNGSGKSTLVKLIVGLYRPDRGKILFNNEPITDQNREWYRQQFSVIFYDFYLFDRLIGIDTSQQQQIEAYLALLEIDNKVTIKDGVFSTVNLSQGQRKRLALLTAYLEDRPIYIFDEWASDQDPVFKRVFYQKLLPELKQRGKTVIAVTHDDRYFDQCDRLIKLDYGRLV